MLQIRAFVGHSFEERDKSVVDAFTDYFDSLKKGMLFEWDHADEAEPKVLAEKVIEKMKDKNLFIGIFTKKDYRVPLKILKETLFRKKACAEKNDFRFGVSDWIIQESGYALGIGLKLLFLIEEGIGRIPGLHGDLEYIEFSKNNVELSNTKINQWLGNYLEELKKEITVEDMKLTSSETKEDYENKEDNIPGEESKPEESDLTKHVNNYLILQKIIAEEKNISKAKNELDRIVYEHKDDKNYDEIFWKMSFCSLKIEAGFPEGLEELKQLADDTKEDTRPRQSLASHYRNYKTYSEAAKQYQIIADEYKDTDKRIDNLIEAAKCFSKNKNFIEAKNLILKDFTNEDYNHFQLSKLYRELGILAKEEGDNNHFISFSEIALEYLPSDSELRFKLAYNSREIKKNDLAFYHYKVLCEQNPSGATFNNIALLYDDFMMPGKSVDLFNKAIKDYSETLSVSNLANKYIKEGFYDEAKKILLKAKEQKDYHENVDSSLLNINKKLNEENELEKSKAELVIKERKFMISYAEAYTRPAQINLEGEWELKHGKITLSREGNRVTGHYEVAPKPGQTPASGQVLGLSNALLTMGTKGTIRDLKGQINNKAIEYSLTIKKKSPDTYSGPHK